MKNGFSEAIRAAAASEGLGVDAFRRKHGLPSASFYLWLMGKPPIPLRTQKALRRLRKAGVKHPVLEVVT